MHWDNIINLSSLQNNMIKTAQIWLQPTRPSLRWWAAAAAAKWLKVTACKMTSRVTPRRLPLAPTPSTELRERGWETVGDCSGAFGWEGVVACVGVRIYIYVEVRA